MDELTLEHQQLDGLTSISKEVEIGREQSVKQQQNVSSKLDTLSREDLVKLVRRQLMTQKELKKQIEIAKSQEKGQSQSAEGGDGEAMLALELADYKNAVQKLRKELAECKEKMKNGELLTEDQSKIIDSLQQNNEQLHIEVKAKQTEIVHLKNSDDEKSRTIDENAKTIESLLLQLNECRVEMQQEIATLEEELRKQGVKLTADQKADSTKNAEIRRLKEENELLHQKNISLQQEFSHYKERAEYALRTNSLTKSPETGSSVSSSKESVPSTTMTAISEVKQLIDSLNTQNTEISQLNTKCSILEEEIKSAEGYSKVLVNELNEMQETIEHIKRQSQVDRQKISEELEQRLRDEQMLRAELQRELDTARERELVHIASAGQKQIELGRECERLIKELDEAKKTISELRTFQNLSIGASTNKPRPTQIVTRLQKLKIPAVLSLQECPAGVNSLSTSILTVNDMLETEGNGRNSESSDSTEDLQSILQDAENEPTSDNPTFNVANALADDGTTIDKLTDTPRMEELFANQEQFVKLQERLVGCQELLSEAEENNIRLNEQISLLKDEIRRLERNQKRTEHLANQNGAEYFKNIVLKFLSPPKVNDERLQLLPALQAILHLSEQELDLVKNNCTSLMASHGISGNQESSTEWAAWIGWK